MNNVFSAYPEVSNTKHYHIWCIEQNNDNDFIDTVEALTGFDSVIEPQV